jgi:hypothetical protein
MTPVPEPTDYDTIPERYAEKIDERPWNALYERPATLTPAAVTAGTPSGSCVMALAWSPSTAAPPWLPLRKNGWQAGPA